MRRRVTHIDLQKFVDIVIHDQAVRQPDAVWLHWVASHVGIVTDVRVVKVGNAFLVCINEVIERLAALDARRIGRHRHKLESAFREEKSRTKVSKKPSIARKKERVRNGKSCGNKER